VKYGKLKSKYCNLCVPSTCMWRIYFQRLGITHRTVTNNYSHNTHTSDTNSNAKKLLSGLTLVKPQND